jgi:hypothetical protein
MHGTASSGLLPDKSLAMTLPLLGCQCCGTTLAVAFKSKAVGKDCQKKKIIIQVIYNLMSLIEHIMQGH